MLDRRGDVGVAGPPKFRERQSQRHDMANWDSPIAGGAISASLFLASAGLGSHSDGGLFPHWLNVS